LAHAVVEVCDGLRSVGVLRAVRRIAEPLLHLYSRPIGVELIGQLFTVVVEQIGEHHVAAAGDDVARKRRAEPARAAGDHDDLSGQLA